MPQVPVQPLPSIKTTTSAPLKASSSGACAASISSTCRLMAAATSGSSLPGAMVARSIIALSPTLGRLQVLAASRREALMPFTTALGMASDSGFSLRHSEAPTSKGTIELSGCEKSQERCCQDTFRPMK